MTITLCGENSFAIRQSLRAIIEAFTKKHGANAVERLEGADTTPAQLREQVSAISLFAPHRLVVLSGASQNKELFAALADIAPGTPDETTLVVTEGTLDKRTKTYKTLKAKTDFKEFPLLSESQLQKWIESRVTEAGGSITAAALRLLAERVGGDQWQLSGDIEKLVSHDKNITEQTVELLVTPNLEVSAFALLDAALAGNTKESQRLLQQMKLRSDPYEFFGLLVWQVHALAMVAVAPNGMSSRELAQRTALKPFVLQKSQGLARRLGMTKVKVMVEQLATLDMQLKSTGVEPWLLVEQTLGKISQK